MAKKNDNRIKTISEPDTNAVPMPMISGAFSQEDIQRRIYTIRGAQVMLDRDLAYLYEVETKRINEAVKRNPNRFPKDFMFQLTQDELDSLRSQNVTLITGSETVVYDDFSRLRSQNATSNRRGGLRYLPFVFTEEGVGQLSSVLKSPIADIVSVRIQRAFVTMRRFISANAGLFQRIDTIERKQIATDDKIEQVMQRMDELSPAPTADQLFATGCIWDAWSYISDLVRSAKKRIILIDNYVDDRVLSLLTKRAEGVTATIHSRYTELFLQDLKKHNGQYPEIQFIQLPHKAHDRFLIIDSQTYLLGASVKDIGTSLCAITKMEISPETILSLLARLICPQKE